ncbi:MAG: hypothetical protein GF381_00510 [Candidatus Pacebacteria bacterium]|nr:hypothetical protein [Candidatus Paceibacterota bacterium]
MTETPSCQPQIETNQSAPQDHPIESFLDKPLPGLTFFKITSCLAAIAVLNPLSFPTPANHSSQEPPPTPPTPVITVPPVEDTHPQAIYTPRPPDTASGSNTPPPPPPTPTPIVEIVEIDDRSLRVCGHVILTPEIAGIFAQLLAFCSTLKLIFFFLLKGIRRQPNDY